MPADVTPIDLFRRRMRREHAPIRRERATPPSEPREPVDPPPPYAPPDDPPNAA